MGWTGWILASAVFLAFYDIAKKHAVAGNAVLPTLLCSTLFGCAAFAAVALAIGGGVETLMRIDARILLLASVKSVIVAVSWVFTFCALRTLPITIATPIRASAPALVFLIAFFLYGERPSSLQGAGMAMVFAGYFAFSWAGKSEGIDFFHCPAVGLAVLGAVFSACSAIWDKYLFQCCRLDKEAVQFVFQCALVIVYGTMLSIRWAFRVLLGGADGGCRFQWRWSIPFVGILLATADWLYFSGIASDGAPISVASLMRRFSVVITFLAGAKFFHERNLVRKGIALAAILSGVILLCL